MNTSRVPIYDTNNWNRRKFRPSSPKGNSLRCSPHRSHSHVHYWRIFCPRPILSGRTASPVVGLEPYVVDLFFWTGLCVTHPALDDEHTQSEEMLAHELRAQIVKLPTRLQNSRWYGHREDRWCHQRLAIKN